MLDYFLRSNDLKLNRFLKLSCFLRVGGRLAGFVALAMFLAAISPAQDEDAIPERYHKSKEPVYLTPQPDHALLYVTRSEYVRLFGLSDFKLFVDDKAAGWLPQRSYLAVQVEPGRRLLWGPSRNEAQRFNFEAGKTYLLALAERYRYVFNGRTRNKELDATWWIERNPQEIKDLVSTGKLEYVTTAEGAMADLNKEATKKFVKTNDKAHDPVEVVLPVSFEKVQFRHAKKGFSLKSWEDTGKLTVSRESIEFKSDKMTLVIPVNDVQWFAMDMIHTRTVGILTSNAGLGEAEWNIMDFTNNGQEETIAFRDGHMLGSGADTRRIYTALQAAAPQKVQSSAKVATAVAALADSSSQQPAGEPAQPSDPAPGQPTASTGNQPASLTSEPVVAESVTAPPLSQPAAAQSATTAPPVPQGKTLASPVLQQDTLANINMVDIANGPTVSECKVDRRVLKMEVTGQPVGVKFKKGRMVAGSWEERWTIDRCGTPVVYNVAYRSDGRGGTDFSTTVAGVFGPDKKDQEKKEPEKETNSAAAPPPMQAASGTTPAPAATSAPEAAASQPATAGALPEGFVLFEGRKDQFTIAIPRDWAVYDQARLLETQGVQRIKDNSFNMIIFYRSPDGVSMNDMSVEDIRKIDTGEVPSFFLQKLKAGDGMSCGGFSEKATKQVVKLVSSESAFTKGATVTEAPHAEPSPVAGCTGVRVQGSGQPRQSSTATKHDVYAASDGLILYLFSLRTPADKFDQSAEVFQKAMATARLVAAK